MLKLRIETNCGDVMENINSVISAFKFKGELESAELYGSGHINTTYLLTFLNGGKEERYILQNLNSNVFKDIENLMENVFSVTNYLREQIKAEGGNENRETLHYIKTVDGKKFYVDGDGKYYRAYVFVENSVSYNSAESAEMFGESGRAFGKFQRLLSDFPAETLHETIPDFHNTAKRYETEFLPAAKADVAGRRATCEREIDFVNARRGYCSRFVDMINNGTLPLRVTHNDTKLNNVMFDKDTGKAVCVIDLDTVMPGLALYDFGDSVRFGANTADEDEKDLSKVGIDLDYFEAYARGFLSEAGHSLKREETDNLAFASLLMTFECGMRFLTDYLNGDTYFKTAYADHNLVRAKNQFGLVVSMEQNMSKMRSIIKDITKNG